jgi:hypothetical protein
MNGATMQEQQRAGLQPDFKIFCDESCHLPHDPSNVMVFGAIRCDSSLVQEVTISIMKLRDKHNFHQELKWTKPVPGKLGFYSDLLTLFCNAQGLRFKATVVQNKHMLDHDKFNAGSAGTFYYKMAYYALRDLLGPGKGHRLYLDYMDTQGAVRAKKMQEVLETGGASWVRTHIIRSHESQLIQLCDFLIGAIAYANRTDIPKDSLLKRELVQLLERSVRRILTVGTPPWEEKFNIFMFSPRKS